MNNTVYLAGLISTDYPESLNWRLDVASYLADAGFRVLSPMRGKANLADTSKDGGVTDDRLTATDIVLRDYWDVRSSSVILANLENFGSPRPLMGTLCELAWAWDHKIPVAAVAKWNNFLMRTHPFISSFVAHYHPSVHEAAEFIATQYLR